LGDFFSAKFDAVASKKRFDDVMAVTLSATCQHIGSYGVK
jgi:hypothetical protein